MSLLGPISLSPITWRSLLRGEVGFGALGDRLLTLKCSALENAFWHTRQTNFLPPDTAGGAVIIPIEAIFVDEEKEQQQKVDCGDEIVGCGTAYAITELYFASLRGFETS